MNSGYSGNWKKWWSYSPHTLDNQKAEAEAAKQSDADRRSLKTRQAAGGHERLKPALLNCYRYLQELIAQRVDRQLMTECYVGRGGNRPRRAPILTVLHKDWSLETHPVGSEAFSRAAVAPLEFAHRSREVLSFSTHEERFAHPYPV